MGRPCSLVAGPGKWVVADSLHHRFLRTPPTPAAVRPAPDSTIELVDVICSWNLGRRRDESSSLYGQWFISDRWRSISGLGGQSSAVGEGSIGDTPARLLAT